MFGLSGNKRGGYNIDDMVSQLNHILGKNQKQKVVIIGCGKMGRALMSYNGFPRVGIRVAAGFDSDPAVLQDSEAVPILHIGRMKDFIIANNIQVAVLCVPEPFAPSIIDSLKKTCIQGVINFAPLSLRSSDDFIIQNINIEQEIENVFYQLHFAQSQKENAEESEID